MPPEDLHDADIALLREPAAAELLGRRHAEDPEVTEAVDDFLGNVRVAIDGGAVDAAFAEAADFGDRLIDLAALFGWQVGVGEQQGTVEVAVEEALGKAERLRSGEQQLLSLLLLLCHLFRGQRHGSLLW